MFVRLQHVFILFVMFFHYLCTFSNFMSHSLCAIVGNMW